MASFECTIFSGACRKNCPCRRHVSRFAHGCFRRRPCGRALYQAPLSLRLQWTALWSVDVRCRNQLEQQPRRSSPVGICRVQVRTLQSRVTRNQRSGLPGSDGRLQRQDTTGGGPKRSTISAEGRRGTPLPLRAERFHSELVGYSDWLINIRGARRAGHPSRSSTHGRCRGNVKSATVPIRCDGQRIGSKTDRYGGPPVRRRIAENGW